jgi:hypothetical protein
MLDLAVLFLRCLLLLLLPALPCCLLAACFTLCFAL